MWTTLVGKEFTSRLQGKLAYSVLTMLVTLFTALALGAFWLLVVNVPTIVPVIGSSAGSGANVTIQALVASNRGAFLFYALTFCLLSAIFVVGPAVASSAISSERENDTFDLLLIGGQRSGALVLGKLVAAVLFVLLLVGTTLPGYAISWMFGPVALRDVLLTLVVVVVTVTFVCSLGLLFSALSRTSTMAALYTYAAVYLLSLGSLFIYLVGASTQNEQAVRVFLSLNPFISLLTVPETLTASLQQTLPFQYRPALDWVSIDLLGQSIRFPRWASTLALYGIGTFVLALITGVAIDPCHRWRTRGERVRA